MFDEFEVENYWEDDMYIINQNEADDYRNELSDWDDEDGDEDW